MALAPGRRSFLIGSLVALGGCATIVGADFDDLKTQQAGATEPRAESSPSASSSSSSSSGNPSITSDGGGGSNLPLGDGGCKPTTFYEDNDGDGWGSAKTVQACAAAPGLSDRTGDCDDGNKDVFPGQTKYFAAPYTSPLGKASFDYDCNSSEDPTPNLVQFQSFPICTTTMLCSASGDNGKYCWEPQHAARTAAGSFDKCGARAWVCLAPAGWHLADTSENLKAYPCR